MINFILEKKHDFFHLYNVDTVKVISFLEFYISPESKTFNKVRYIQPWKILSKFYKTISKTSDLFTKGLNA